jgi:hypothetical protein
MNENPFIGAWHLVAANFYKPSGELVKLYGDNPTGMIVYGERGTMCVQIMQRGRPPLPKGRTAENALQEYHSILSGYIAYFGTYEIDPKVSSMTHHIKGSLIPEWIGTDLVRTYEFSGNRLTLRTAPAPARGDVLWGELIWERAE